jgi:hypothetical protein
MDQQKKTALTTIAAVPIKTCSKRITKNSQDRRAGSCNARLSLSKLQEGSFGSDR